MEKYTERIWNNKYWEQHKRLVLAIVSNLK